MSLSWQGVHIRIRWMVKNKEVTETTQLGRSYSGQPGGFLFPTPRGGGKTPAQLAAQIKRTIGSDGIRFRAADVRAQRSLPVRLCHSRMMFVHAYPRETQKMVFDAHDRAFAFFKRWLASFELAASRRSSEGN